MRSACRIGMLCCSFLLAGCVLTSEETLKTPAVSVEVKSDVKEARPVLADGITAENAHQKGRELLDELDRESNPPALRSEAAKK